MTPESDSPLSFEDHPQHLRRVMDSVMEAADPVRLVRASLRIEGDALVSGPHRLALHSDGRVFLIGLGKAAPAMTEAAADILGDALAGGMAAVPEGTATEPPDRIRYFEAGHPLPTEASLAAGEAAAELLSQVEPEDRVLVLVSGGGSAMFERPADAVSLDDLRDVNRKLLVSGAPIDEVNAVRKALSQVKGGGLVRLASPAPVLALVLSDVVGDRLASVASGPTAIQPGTHTTARAVLERYELSDKVSDPVRQAVNRTPAGEPPMYRPLNVLIGGNRLALDAARSIAQDLGFEVQTLSTTMEGEARQVGRSFADSLRAAPPNTCLLQGGETTVTVEGNGKGGRNQELALAAALALDGAGTKALLAFATDGLDGPTDAAGAIVSSSTAQRLRSADVDSDAHLQANDSYRALEAVQALVKTGPTGTNVNDVVVGLAYPAESGSS